MYVKSQLYKDELDKYIDAFPEVFKILSGSQVLITGAAGLIGNYLTDLLLEAGDIKVIALDRCEKRSGERFRDYRGNKNFIPVICDANDFTKIDEVFSKNEIDYVIHAASNTSPIDYVKFPVDTITINVISTRNILECCKNYKTKRFMFCSSVESYGLSDLDELDELSSGYVDCNSLRAAYPSGKRAAESMCRAYYEEYGVDYVNARIGRIYGPTVIKEDVKAPTQFILNSVKGEDIILKSAGTQVYSFGYVGDCASALLKVLTKGESGEVYNVASEEGGVKLLDFARASADAGGVKVAFDRDFDLSKSGYSKITRAVLSVKKLQGLGYRSLYNYKNGVKRTVDYLKNNE